MSYNWREEIIALDESASGDSLLWGIPNDSDFYEDLAKYYNVEPEDLPDRLVPGVISARIVDDMLEFETPAEEGEDGLCGLFGGDASPDDRDDFERFIGTKPPLPSID